MRAVLIWGLLGAVMLGPIALAAASPLLAWRQPVYILGGFAGIVAMAVLLLQPLLAARRLPGLGVAASRRAHRWVGGSLVCLVILHVAGLWVTSPPDMIDALTFTSPTPFSAWGVIAMWAMFGAAALAGARRRLRWPAKRWRLSHAALATVTVAGSAVHAVLIEGAMEPVTKALLCAAVVAATLVWWRDLLRR